MPLCQRHCVCSLFILHLHSSGTPRGKLLRFSRGGVHDRDHCDLKSSLSPSFFIIHFLLQLLHKCLLMRAWWSQVVVSVTSQLIRVVKAVMTFCVVDCCVLQWWWCAFCATPSWSNTATDVGSTPALWCPAAPMLWVCSWWETSRWILRIFIHIYVTACFSFLLLFCCFFFLHQTGRNDPPDCNVVLVRWITPNLSTMWVLEWHFQRGCCSCACSVCSPTGWLWLPLTTGWPISELLLHWEPWCPSSLVSFTH